MCDISIKITALLVFFISAVQAGTYKWIDENGNVHYSESPPKSNSVEVEELTIQSTSKGASSSSDESYDVINQAAERKKRRIENKEKKDKELAEAENKKKQCGQIKKRLAALQASSRSFEYDDDGNIVRMGEDKRQNEIKYMNEEMKKHCS